MKLIPSLIYFVAAAAPAMIQALTATQPLDGRGWAIAILSGVASGAVALKALVAPNQ